MSDDGSLTDMGDANIDTLLDKACLRLGTEGPLSLTSHLKGLRALLKAKDRAVAGEVPNSKTVLRAVCCGVSLYRRCSVGDGTPATVSETTPRASATVEAEKRDAEELNEIVRTSGVLVFVLLCLFQLREAPEEDRSGSLETLRSLHVSTLADVVSDPPERYHHHHHQANNNKRDAPGDPPAETEAEAKERAEAEARYEAWRRRPRPSSSTVALVALSAGTAEVAKDSEEHLPWLMSTFFRASQAKLAESMVLPEGDVDFSTLGFVSTARMSEEDREKALLGICECAESEAGQSIVRDLLLSFILPTDVVGVRRTLILPREASTHAGVHFPTEIARAHDAAMSGAAFLWSNGADDTERMCCLLAGLAILTTRGVPSDDPIRKLDAFLGRVQMPFLETAPPPPNAQRLLLVPALRRWVVFSLHPKTHRPVVVHSERGFDGLCNCALKLLENLKKS